MSLIDFVNEKNQQSARPATRGATRTNARGEEQPNAILWVNVGIEVNGRFVNLPMGLPLDTMKEIAIRGQNKEWNEFTAARNGLLNALIAQGDNLEPGAEMVVPSLQVRVRKINSEPVIDEVNEYSVDFNSLFAGNKVIAQKPAQTDPTSDPVNNAE